MHSLGASVRAVITACLGTACLGLACPGLARLCAACLVVAGTGAAAHAAEPVVFRLGYGGAAEEPMWLLISKPALVPFDEELNVVVAKSEFLARNAAAVRALLEDLTATMRFYLDRPREARQLPIDLRMVRANPDVHMVMRDYFRDPTLRVDADALERMQAFQIGAGFQTKRADVRSRVDRGYLPR
jgi:hypothetical protein